MKLFQIGLVVLLGSCFAANASGADNAKLLVGKWEAVEADPGSLPKGSVVEFSADGKMTVLAKKGDKEEEMKGTYTVDGDSFTFKLKFGTEEVSQKITIKKLTETQLDTVSADSKAVSFKRSK